MFFLHMSCSRREPGLAKFVLRLTRAPQSTQPLIEHITCMMVRRAVTLVNQIPPLCALYHPMLLNKLQRQTL